MTIDGPALDVQLLRVRDKLSAARNHDNSFKRFGASRHRYQLGRVLPATELERFEAATGVALPHDFRRFVIEVGNGGAGPAYGWPPFNPGGEIYRRPDWRASFSVRSAADEEDDDLELSGYIALSEHGCGIFDFLVVNGPECGHVWFSDDGGALYPLPSQNWDSHEGLPNDWTASVKWRQRLASATNTSRISFVDYVEKWLDEVLADSTLSSR